MSAETSFKKPMLAYPYEAKRLTDSVFYQPKLDGIRCLAMKTKDGWDLRTRTGKPITSVPHILEALSQQQTDEENGTILDGELYLHGADFNWISGICRHKKPHADHEQIEYWVYDVVHPDAFMNRIFWLMLGEYKPPIYVVETKRDFGHENLVRKYHDSYVEDGYEGLIIRPDKEDGYVHKRSFNLLKFKDFQDDEFVVLDIEEGDPEKEKAGLCVAVWCETKEGKRFKARPVGNNEFTRWMAENPKKVVGQKVTVKYQNLSADGIPRFGIAKGIRWDK